MAIVLIKGEETQTHTQCVKMEAEIKVMCLQAKEYQELVASPKTRNDHQEKILLSQPSEGTN